MTHSPGPTYLQLCHDLHGTERGPFGEPGDFLEEDNSYPHTNIGGDFLWALMPLLRPQFLVEIGSMTGGSALRIADAALAAAAGEYVPCLLCIDTWLGDTKMWLNHQAGWRDWLRLRRGCPGLYWQFLANVRRMQDVILPLQITSTCGLRALQHLVLRRKAALPRPEFIYLDSAHEKGETLLEIEQAFALLAPGGVIVGDDLDWPAVEGDLRAFLAQTPGLAPNDDPLLSQLPGVFFLPEAGHWVVDGACRQWLLRKSGTEDVDVLQAAVVRDEFGAEPSEYVALTEVDRQALRDYEAGTALLEAGQVPAGSDLLRRAAAASPSLASYFGI